MAPIKSIVKKVCGSMIFGIYLVGRSNHVEVVVLTKMSTCDLPCCHYLAVEKPRASKNKYKKYAYNFQMFIFHLKSALPFSNIQVENFEGGVVQVCIDFYIYAFGGSFYPKQLALHLWNTLYPYFPCVNFASAIFYYLSYNYFC